MKTMEIIPRHGFGGTRLGMSQESVRAQLGPPFTTEVDEQGEEDWSYPDIGITCSFSRELDGLLSSIRFASPVCKLYGQQVIGLPER